MFASSVDEVVGTRTKNSRSKPFCSCFHCCRIVCRFASPEDTVFGADGGPEVAAMCSASVIFPSRFPSTRLNIFRGPGGTSPRSSTPSRFLSHARNARSCGLICMALARWSIRNPQKTRSVTTVENRRIRCI